MLDEVSLCTSRYLRCSKSVMSDLFLEGMTKYFSRLRLYIGDTTRAVYYYFCAKQIEELVTLNTKNWCSDSGLECRIYEG